MIHSAPRVRFTIVQLGPLERAEVENALGLANRAQRAFDFAIQSKPVSIRSSEYKLQNSGWDLDAAVRKMLAKHPFPRPVIFMTSLPYSDRDNRTRKDWFYFAEYTLDADAAVSVVSTHLWRQLPGVRRPQPYVLFNLATVALSFCAGLNEHEETYGCPFDYCNEPAEIDAVFSSQGLCPECEIHLNAGLRAGKVSVEQVAAARKLLNRARGRRSAFVVMPFQPHFDTVYVTVRSALEASAWHVVRADELARPRRITDAIVQAILTSDLVVADLTGHNPNVFYELGVAHAAGCDIIMLTQERRIPFDVSTDRAVMYRPSRRGLAQLEEAIKSLIR